MNKTVVKKAYGSSPQKRRTESETKNANCLEKNRVGN